MTVTETIDTTPTTAAADRVAALRAKRERSDSARLVVPTELRGAPDGPTWRNPTVWLLAVAIAGWVAGWAGYLTGAASGWLVVPLNAVAAYLGFTVFHESVHRTAHRNRLVNDVMGWLPALMLTYIYPVFRSCHLQHHAHTNDPEHDPDLSVAYSPALLRPVWLLWTAVHYRRLCHRHQWATTGARRAQMVFDATLVLSIPVAVLTGSFAMLWALYLGPLLLAGLFLYYAFDYLPHHPHDSTERYLDTRIQPGRARHAVLLAQNYHLIHHLWVSVPWFRYRAVFAEVEEGLRAKGARIDNRRAG